MKNSIQTIVCLMAFLLIQSAYAQKKNVLFIMVDDLNDFIGVMNGHPQTLTPNLNKFAQRSVIFQNTHCSSPICVPSRTALLTGRRPHETGITNNIDGYFRSSSKPQWMRNIVTLPQYFKQKGYETVTVGKIFHFSISGGSNRDPISWSIDAGAGVGGNETPINKYQIPNTSLIYSPIKETLTQTKDWKRAEYCVNYLKKSHSKPFFLACGISRPHLPFYVPQEFFNKFDLSTIKLPPYLLDDLKDLKFNFSLNHLQHVQKVNKWKDVVRAYLASVAYADACIGYLLNELEKSAYKNNTIVVLMGDHGFHLGEKNHFHKFTLWEKALKTPLIIYDPSIRKTGSCNKVVSLQDIYPTLVDLCTLPKPNFTVRGRSLRKLIENPALEWKGLALASYARDNYKLPDSHSFRMDRYHYIWYYNGDEELYDLQNDPNEWTNLAYKSSYLTLKNQMNNYMRAMLAGDENPFDKSHLNDFALQKDTEEIEGFEENGSFNLYPNPTSSFTKIQLYSTENTELNISITDVYGKEIKSFRVQSGFGKMEYAVDLSDMKKGIYFIYINHSQRKRLSKKLIIE